MNSLIKITFLLRIDQGGPGLVRFGQGLGVECSGGSGFRFGWFLWGKGFL